MLTYGLVKTVCIGSTYMAKSKACSCRTQLLVCLSVCMVFGILSIYFALDMVDCDTDMKNIWEKRKNKKLDFQSSWYWSQPSRTLSLFGCCHLSPLQQSSSGLVLVLQHLSQSTGTGVGPLVLLLSHWCSHHFFLLCIIPKQAASWRSFAYYIYFFDK